MSLLIKKLRVENNFFRSKIAELEKKRKKLETYKDIISKVNTLLDRSLYELGVINKINRILTSVLNYQRITKSIMDLLGEMINYDLAAILIYLLEDRSIKADIKIDLAVSKSRSEIENFTRRIILPFVETNILTEESVRTEIFDTSKLVIQEDKAISNNEDMNIEDAVLKVGNRVIGMLFIAKEGDFCEEDKRLLRLVANTSAIAIENSLLHKKIEQLAITNGLTSLYNHRQFMEGLIKEIKRAQRYNLMVSLIMLDIDDFKKINDTYGHLKGDEVLRNLSYIIKKNLHRGIDIAARYGGEEFGIILPNTHKEGAMIISEIIRKEVFDTLGKLCNIKERITISSGIATYPCDANTEKEIINQADLALYKAKKEGKNKTCVINTSIT